MTVMNEPAPQVTSNVPNLTPAEELEVKQLDLLIEQGRISNVLDPKAKTELHWLRLTAMFFWVPIVFSFWLPKSVSHVVGSYLTIIAIVVSGFGIYRVTGIRRKGNPPAFRFLNSLIFMFLFLGYSAVLWTIVQDSDPQWRSHGMRKK
jgi:hypothetical protein